MTEVFLKKNLRELTEEMENLHSLISDKGNKICN